MSEFTRSMVLKHGYSERQALAFTARYWDNVSYWRFRKALMKIREVLESHDCNSLIFGPGGGCRLCRTCNVHLNQSCKHPKDSMPSPESWGIDVYGTLLKKGIAIEIPPRRVFTRVGLICLNDDIKLANSMNSMNSRTLPKYRKLTLNEVLNKTSKKLCGEVLEVVRLRDYFTGKDYCTNCQRNNIFLCDRSFLPREVIQDFIANRLCIVIKFKNAQELAKNAWKWTKELHRHGYYNCLPFANFPCNLCSECSPKGCTLTNKRRQKKYGQKRLWRCIYYLSVEIDGYEDRNDILFLVV